MEDMCTGCLSTGRTLYFIGETGYYHLYSLILNEIPIYNLSQVCIRVCWECRARLRTMQRFKQQVQRNYCDLMQHIPPQGNSCLSSHSQYQFSYPDVKSEVVVKCESDRPETEHCEPEPFASVLSMEWDGRSEEKVKQPLKKKKKPKMLLKIPKSYNMKKKRKKKPATSIENTVKSDNIEDKTESTENNIDNIESNIENTLEDNIEENINDNTEDNIEEKTIEDNNVIEDIVKTETKVPDNKKRKERVAKVKASVVKLKRPRDATPLPARPQCQECGKVFSSKKTYRYHLNVLHKGQNQYPCPRCGKVYQWKSNLGRHMRSHRAVDDGELHCSLCDKSFASVATYRQHLRISRRHVAETDFSYACDECGKRFVNKTRLRDHVDWDHLNRIKFRCTLCDKPFKCHTSLYVHTQNVHVGKEKKDNLCHVCGKSYQNAAKLKYHITAMHSGETPYRCSACDAAFGWYSSLYRHMREVHHKLKGVPKKAKKLKQPRVSPPVVGTAQYAAL